MCYILSLIVLYDSLYCVWYNIEPHLIHIQAVLVEAGSRSARLRKIAPRNRDLIQAPGNWSSYELADKPGFLLNHCCGLMFFFDKPANDERTFRNDATWQLKEPKNPSM